MRSTDWKSSWSPRTKPEAVPKVFRLISSTAPTATVSPTTKIPGAEVATALRKADPNYSPAEDRDARKNFRIPVFSAYVPLAS